MKPLRIRWRVREQVRRDLDEEIRFHIDARTRELVASGMTEADARARALREFGNLDEAKRALGRESRRTERRLRTWEFLTGLARDTRYGIRLLRKQPGFAFAVILTLGLGIGATTAIFSVLNGVVLRPLDFPDSGRLVSLCETHETFQGYCVASFVNAADWNERSRSFGGIGAGRGWSFIYKSDSGSESVRGGLADARFFRVFGFAPELGRLFRPEDLGPGASRVAVLSHATWRARVGADAGVIGRSIILDDRGTTVIGVLPEGAEVPQLGQIEIWRPIPFDAAEPDNRAWRGFVTVGRLRDHVDLEAGLADLSGIAAGLGDQYPDSNAGWGVTGVSLHEEVVGSARSALMIFMGAVVFVLLIGCANVANLFMARAAGRESEFAIRLSIGARRARLVRMLLTEGLVLSALGGAVGLALAVAAVRAFVVLAPRDIPRVENVAMDGTALAFTVALLLATTLLFGLVPALRSSSVNTAKAIRASREAAGRSALGGRAGLVVAEVALVLVLLIGAGLLVRTFAEVAGWDPGFRRDGLLTFWALASEGKYESGDRVVDMFGRVADEIEALPSVEAIGGASAGPLFGGRETTPFAVEGRADYAPGSRSGDAREGLPVARWYDVSPGYFRVMGIPLRQGRSFDSRDARGAPLVAVVNETLVRRSFPTEDPIGRRITLPEFENESLEIVGVVADVPPFLPGTAAVPEVYWPIAQHPRHATYFIVRHRGDAAALVPLIRQRLRAVDPDLGVRSFEPMTELVSRELVSPRFNMALLVAFAVVSLVLAGVGIYGVIAYNVSRRRHEIGLRRAFGASNAAIIAHIFRMGFVPAALGLALGLAGALALTRLMVGMLHGVAPTDPATFLGITLLLAAIAGAACYVPARRAARIDPLEAIRAE